MALSRWSVPIGVLTTVIGGSAWLTTTHNKVNQIDSDMTTLRAEFNVSKDRISDRLLDQDQRLSRIEGKLDIVIREVKRGKNGKDNPGD